MDVSQNHCNLWVSKTWSSRYTARISLSLQVLGQCKGVISAVVSVLCFHNLVPVLGWFGYSVTVAGCFMYGRCKAHARKLRHMMKSSMSELMSQDLESGHQDYSRPGQITGSRLKLPFELKSFFWQGAFDVGARGKIAPINNGFETSNDSAGPNAISELKRSGTCSSLLGSTIGAGHAGGSSDSPSEHIASPSSSPIDGASSGALRIQVALPC